MNKTEAGYICFDGRLLTHDRTEVSESKGFRRTFEVYSSKDCSGCTHKAKCLYKYNEENHKDKNKTIKVNERWDELKEKSNSNIQSEKGILNRMIRSIQTEGFFADMKENDGFRRFNHRSKDKVFKELMIYIFSKNTDKYHKSTTGKIKRLEGKSDQAA